jgi:hypothetical protein
MLRISPFVVDCTHVEDLMNVEEDVEHVEREPRQGEDHDDGDEERVRARLLLDLLAQPVVLDARHLVLVRL